MTTKQPRTLKDYQPQHDDECPTAARNMAGNCTCGLDALLRLPDKPEHPACVNDVCLYGSQCEARGECVKRPARLSETPPRQEQERIYNELAIRVVNMEPFTRGRVVKAIHYVLYGTHLEGNVPSPHSETPHQEAPHEDQSRSGHPSPVAPLPNASATVMASGNECEHGHFGGCGKPDCSLTVVEADMAGTEPRPNCQGAAPILSKPNTLPSRIESPEVGCAPVMAGEASATLPSEAPKAPHQFGETPSITTALECIGHIINDAPYRGEERDWAWHAWLTHKQTIAAVVAQQGQEIERIQELLAEFDITDADVLKHTLEDHRRWAKDVPRMSIRLEAAESQLAAQKEGMKE